MITSGFCSVFLGQHQGQQWFFQSILSPVGELNFPPLLPTSSFVHLWAFGVGDGWIKCGISSGFPFFAHLVTLLRALRVGKRSFCPRTSTDTVCNDPKSSLILFIPVSTIWWAWKSHPIKKLDTLASCCCSSTQAVSLSYVAKSTIALSLLLPTSTFRLCRQRAAPNRSALTTFWGCLLIKQRGQEIKMCVFQCRKADPFPQQVLATPYILVSNPSKIT